MLSALDDAIGNLTQKLKDVGAYDNTIIIYELPITIRKQAHNIILLSYMIIVSLHYNMKKQL